MAHVCHVEIKSRSSPIVCTTKVRTRSFADTAHFCRPLRLILYFLYIASKKRKTNCSQDVLDVTRKMVFEEGKSKINVAELLGMPESTPRKRLKKEDVASS